MKIHPPFENTPSKNETPLAAKPQAAKPQASPLVSLAHSCASARVARHKDNNHAHGAAQEFGCL
jgi:hypothetical protein